MATGSENGLYWDRFQSLVERLRLLQVVEMFFGHPAAVVVGKQVSAHLMGPCFHEQPSMPS